MNIDNVDGKYEISDFGRVFIILWVELENEGKYICKYLGKNEIVFLNVICKIFVKIYIFNLLKINLVCMILNIFIKIMVKIGMYSEIFDWNL